MQETFLISANENLKDAEILFEHELYNASANRAYYSVFHATLATLFSKGYNPAIEHRTVLSLFCNEFINKKKCFPSTFKRMIYELRHARNQADYGSGISRKISNNRLKDSKELLENILKEINNEN